MVQALITSIGFIGLAAFSATSLGLPAMLPQTGKTGLSVALCSGGFIWLDLDGEPDPDPLKVSSVACHVICSSKKDVTLEADEDDAD